MGGDGHFRSLRKFPRADVVYGGSKLAVMGAGEDLKARRRKSRQSWLEQRPSILIQNLGGRVLILEMVALG